jgi:aryl-alcohol dehydrogenase-like predicted oxidoreductase
MRVTGEGVWGDPPDREAAKAVLRRAVSNVNEHELRQAQRLTEIVAVQNRYNPTDRESDGLIDMCAGAVGLHPLGARDRQR